MLKSLKVRLRGACPMLLHNGQLANPLNSHAKKLKSLSGKRGKTEEDILAMAKVEFEAGWYTNSEGAYTLPAHNIEASMLEGAKKNKNGRIMQGGAFIVDDPILKFNGSGRSMEQLWAGGEHALMVSVAVQRNRVMRTRPMVTDWMADVEVKYDDTVIEPEVILQALEVAGLERGLGDWRPKYGRFVVEQI